MAFIKSFQEFRTQLESISEKAISGGAVTKETPKAGELARYTVTLKATEDTDTISDANPAQSALDFLINSQDFKTWYSGMTTLKDAAGQDFDLMNSQSVAFIETGKHRQAGFLRREKAVETFVFKPVARRAANTDTESDLMYELTKFQPQAKSVDASGVTVYAWNSEQEPEMKLATPKRVNLVFADLTVDLAMKSGTGSTVSQPAATAASAAADAKTAAASEKPGATPSVQKYVGLKLTQTFDKRIQDLQRLILAKGGAPAQAIKDRGGAVGKYGSGTAKAIGMLIGTNVPVNEITPDIDAKLQAALAGVTEPTAASKSTSGSQAGEKAASPASASKSTAGGSTKSASDTVKRAAEKILKALQGATEDEKSVYEVFGEGKKEPYIKDYRELNALITYWNSQKAPLVRGKIGYRTFDQLRQGYPNRDQKTTTLQYWLKTLLNADEIAKINELIKGYATFKF